MITRTICNANCPGGDVQCEERSDEPERQPCLDLCQTKEKVKKKSQQIDGEQDKNTIIGLGLSKKYFEDTNIIRESQNIK